MGSRESGRSPDRLQTEDVLRILRVEPGDSHTIRTLSRHYGGCFTHYKGRSHYCPGREECQYHKLDVQWKGYALVERWEGEGILWRPFVLEITEGLELDLRGKWDRGQVWEISRLPQVKAGKATPVRGRRLEERDPDTFPPEFDFTAVLLHTYHVRQIRLDKENPLPPRILISSSTGAPPVDPRRPAEKPRLSAAEIQAQLAAVKARGSSSAASAEANGHAH